MRFLAQSRQFSYPWCSLIREVLKNVKPCAQRWWKLQPTTGSEGWEGGESGSLANQPPVNGTGSLQAETPSGESKGHSQGYGLDWEGSSPQRNEFHFIFLTFVLNFTLPASEKTTQKGIQGKIAISLPK